MRKVEIGRKAVRDFIKRFGAERKGHTPIAAHRIDKNRIAGALHVFEEERSAMGLADPVGNLGNFQNRRNRRFDTGKLTERFEFLQEGAQIFA